MDSRSSYHLALKKLKDELMYMGSVVEEQIRNAVDSLSRQDEKKAIELIEKDDRIDDMMLDIEDQCIRLVALQQPMAGDLRTISMASKIAVDLERIADHAVDIARITKRLIGEPLVKPLEDIPRMAEYCVRMLRECLTAYADGNVQRAASLAELDDEVDRLYAKIIYDITGLMSTDPIRNKQLIHLLMVGHYLERVADHTTNIAEGTIFMVTGRRSDLNQ
ncbi:phosphate signaling complex protein PhoU [Gorillibacterium sp. sgz5001074]|uniref:phosphate signaling complex protein PhoU n=1 Tax=Gorillibacterium sp. sgz5001074 TaxID=3446695 RepID=UPI003F6774A5